MATKNDISSEILQRIIESGKEEIRIDTDNFWQSIVRGDKQQFSKRCARLIGLLFVTIAVVGFVLYSAIFYVQNVLLYKADLQVNNFGAFIRKSYNSEYAMFLFDASEPWAASGIQVQKGDKLFIAASGAFHTNIYELINAAESNRWADLREQYKDNTDELNDKKRDTVYRYIYMTNPPSMQDSVNKPYVIDTLHRKVRKPINLKDTALFGDVLFQIIPEYLMRDTGYLKVEQVYAIPRKSENIKETTSICKDGVLSFCVNDDNPYNNVGQVLVVMEIYRKQTKNNAAMKILKGQLLDYPYFWLDYYKHKGNKLFATILFILITFFEYIGLCAVCYLLPFLFLKETWIKFGNYCKGLIQKMNHA